MTPSTLTIRVGVALALVALMSGSGCKTRIGGGKEARVADMARRVNDLEREVQLQTLRANEAEAKLAEASRAPVRSSEVELATPALAGIEIDRLSGPTPSDVSSFPIFVRTLDGRGRFLQVVGTLDVQVFIAAEQAAGVERAGERAGERVGGVTLGPLELREAYRSSVTGTHYRVDITPGGTLGSAAFGGLSRYDLRIVARLVDARTGRAHESSLVIGARDRRKGR